MEDNHCVCLPLVAAGDAEIPVTCRRATHSPAHAHTRSVLYIPVAAKRRENDIRGDKLLRLSVCECTPFPCVAGGCGWSGEKVLRCVCRRHIHLTWRRHGRGGRVGQASQHTLVPNNNIKMCPRAQLDEHKKTGGQHNNSGGTGELLSSSAVCILTQDTRYRRWRTLALEPFVEMASLAHKYHVTVLNVDSTQYAQHT